MIKTAQIGFVLVLGMVGFSAQTLANTPDGETPAIETICNEYKDSIPGLYGLCDAYCEAQDLDAYSKNPTADVLEGNFARRGGGSLACGSNPEEVPQ